MNEQTKTPPAATGGVDANNSCSEQQHNITEGGAREQDPVVFWEDSPYALLDDLPETDQAQRDVMEFARPPGLAGELADYVFYSAHRPMVEAAVIAALGLIAGIAGRCYNFQKSGLNLYLLLLATTGRGKSAVDNGINRLVSAVRNRGVFMVDEFLGPDSLASGQALLREVSENPCFLCVFGEFGHTLKILSDPRANASETMQLKVLLDLYNRSGQDDYLRPRKHSDKERNTRVVRAPAISIIGESTPETVEENLSPSEISSGLLPRFLVVECTSERPAPNRGAAFAPPDSLTEQLAELVKTALTMKNNQTFVDVGITATAAALLDEVEAEIEKSYKDSASVERELWNRAMQNIGRIAGLLAVGCDQRNPVITDECVRWAAAFVKRSVLTVVRKFRAGLIGSGESRQEAYVKRIVHEYLNMTPRERATYVSQKVVQAINVVPYAFLRRRAGRCNAFSRDKRGFKRALDDTLLGLCQAGHLRKMDKNLALKQYGVSSGELYVVLPKC